MEEGNTLKSNKTGQINHNEKKAITVSFFFKIAETIVIVIKCTINPHKKTLNSNFKLNKFLGSMDVFFIM